MTKVEVSGLSYRNTINFLYHSKSVYHFLWLVFGTTNEQNPICEPHMQVFPNLISSLVGWCTMMLLSKQSNITQYTSLI